MKKEYFYAIGAFVVLVFISIFLIGGMNAKALDNDDTTTNTEDNSAEVVEDTTNDDTTTDIEDNSDTDTAEEDNEDEDNEDEDNATFTEMLDNFVDKYLPALISFLSLLGTAIITCIVRKIFDKVSDKISNATDKTEEQKQALLSQLAETQKAMEEWFTKFQDAINNLSTTNTNAEDLIDLVNNAEDREKMLKEFFKLIAQGFAELQRNGISTEILKLAQDTIKEETNTDTNTENKE